MNLESLKKEVDFLITHVDYLDEDFSANISSDLESIIMQLSNLNNKTKSLLENRGISNSKSKENSDALLPYINHLRRENAYYEVLEYKQAVEELKRVISESTDSHVIASAYNGLGHIYSAHKNYPKALDSFQKVVDFYPSYSDGYFNLGATYYNLRLYEEAIIEFKKVITMDHNDQETLLALSYAYLNNGINEMGKYYYQRYLDSKNENISQII